MIDILPSASLRALMSSEPRKPQHQQAICAYLDSIIRSGAESRADESPGISPIQMHSEYFELDSIFELEYSSNKSGQLPPSTALSEDAGKPIPAETHREKRPLRSYVIGMFDHPTAIVVGPPGSGKSTALHFAMIYHATAIRDHASWHSLHVLGENVQTHDLQALFSTPHKTKSAPPYRLPLKITLRHFSEWLGMNPDGTIEEYLARTISENAKIQVTPADVLREMEETPSILLLDGLDEVATTEGRDSVMDAVHRIYDLLRNGRSNFRIVITTRPPATRAMGRLDGVLVSICPLTYPQISAYFAMRARQSCFDHEHRIATENRLRLALQDPRLKELTRTMLQANVVFELAESGQTIPARRSTLFEKYATIVFEREAGKWQNVASNKRMLQDVHARAAYNIHENAGRSIPRDSFRQLAISVIDDGGYCVTGSLQNFIDGIVEAATDRLCFIIGTGDDKMEFELQSFQEYFTALHIYLSVDARPPREELRSLALAGAYWRNVLRFSAGMFQPAEIVWFIQDVIEDILDDPEHRCRPGQGINVAVGVILSIGEAELSPKDRWRQLLRFFRSSTRVVHLTVFEELLDVDFLALATTGDDLVALLEADGVDPLVALRFITAMDGLVDERLLEKLAFWTASQLDINRVQWQELVSIGVRYWPTGWSFSELCDRYERFAETHPFPESTEIFTIGRDICPGDMLTAEVCGYREMYSICTFQEWEEYSGLLLDDTRRMSELTVRFTSQMAIGLPRVLGEPSEGNLKNVRESLEAWATLRCDEAKYLLLLYNTYLTDNLDTQYESICHMWGQIKWKRDDSRWNPDYRFICSRRDNCRVLDCNSTAIARSITQTDVEAIAEIGDYGWLALVSRHDVWPHISAIPGVSTDTLNRFIASPLARVLEAIDQNMYHDDSLGLEDVRDLTFMFYYPEPTSKIDFAFDAFVLADWSIEAIAKFGSRSLYPAPPLLGSFWVVAVNADHEDQWVQLLNKIEQLPGAVTGGGNSWVVYALFWAASAGHTMRAYAIWRNLVASGVATQTSHTIAAGPHPINPAGRSNSAGVGQFSVFCSEAEWELPALWFASVTGLQNGWKVESELFCTALITELENWVGDVDFLLYGNVRFSALPLLTALLSWYPLKCTPQILTKIVSTIGPSTRSFESLIERYRGDQSVIEAFETAVLDPKHASPATLIRLAQQAAELSTFKYRLGSGKRP